MRIRLTCLSTATVNSLSSTSDEDGHSSTFRSDLRHKHRISTPESWSYFHLSSQDNIQDLNTASSAKNNHGGIWWDAGILVRINCVNSIGIQDAIDSRSGHGSRIHAM